MEPTVFACTAIGAASVLLAVDGAACLGGADRLCVVDRPSNIVMVIIGCATLVPIAACLLAAWRDRRNSADATTDATERLLDEQQEAPKPQRVLVYLYSSHLLSAWGDRMWQFAVPILFMEIFVDTLLPSALFTLAMYAACILVIPSVGRLLDHTNRWRAMQFAIVAENLMIVLSSAILGLILLVTNADGVHKPAWTPRLLLLFGGTLVCGGVGQVLNDAQSLAIERDWVVVIAGSDSTALAQLNTTMRRIDLLCKILGPMAFGVIMDFAGHDPTTRAMVGAATVAIWNVLSTPLEYFMTRDMYHLVPELAVKQQAAEELEEENQEATDGSRRPRKSVWCSRYVKLWLDYAKHPVFLVSFSYCSLYMTVLDGDALNTAYLKWRGVPDSVLGSSRGAGALFGLVGTLVFPMLRQWIGRVERVAVLSIWLFWLCLAPILAAFVVAGESHTSDYVMLGCMVFSRVWLWSADLAETQIMQEWIEPHRRGAVNAMQTASYQFFYMLIQIMGMVFHDPRDFEVLVVFSLATVLLAAVGFSSWDLRFGRRRAAFVSLVRKG